MGKGLWRYNQEYDMWAENHPVNWETAQKKTGFCTPTSDRQSMYLSCIVPRFQWCTIKSVVRKAGRTIPMCCRFMSSHVMSQNREANSWPISSCHISGYWVISAYNSFISWDILPNYWPPRYETVGNPQYGSFITLFGWLNPNWEISPNS